MSEKYPGGFITKNAPQPTGGESGSAPGIWTLDQAMQYTKAGTWPIQPLPKYIEDVFSTYLYTGTRPTTQTINNGIDLAGEGGLVWTKSRSNGTYNHVLIDTLRGTDTEGYLRLFANLTNGTAGSNAGLTAFNSSGYSIGTSVDFNADSETFVSWTFRKAEKFFDVVTYTGNGAGTQTINHSLGSTPGFIVVKRLNATSDWWVYHRSLSFGDSLRLNLTNAVAAVYEFGTVNSTSFEVVANALCASGGTYVAYIFAHNAGGFGLTGTDNVISCGSFTSSGSGTATITLGYEPQWFLFKSSSAAGDWQIIDNMRGWSMGSQQILKPNSSAAEELNIRGPITPTGINITDAGAVSTTFIYIAIRRGPMKTPTSSTTVFTPIARTGTGANATVTGIGFAPDLIISGTRNQALGNAAFDRLRGANNVLFPYLTNAEDQNRSDQVTAFNNNSLSLGADTWFGNVNQVYNYAYWIFGRAPGFFDVVCYTGTGVNRTVSHNLGVAPELMIVKRRSTADGEWSVYSSTIGNANRLRLNATDASTSNTTSWNSTTPTSSVFTVGTNTNTNQSGQTFVAYLFASVAGVSKVGSYTGTGTTQQINCGFTNGSRFVLIKRTDSTGDWYVWDSARGIVAGNDPYLLLNSAAVEVTNTDYVDTFSSGFEISSTAPAAINANGGTFIFLAIA